MNLTLFSTRLSQAELLFNVLALVPKAITLAEKFIPSGLTQRLGGTAKLDKAVGYIEKGLAAAGHGADEIKAALPQIKDEVNAAVAEFHAIGIFKKAAGLTGAPANG